jgi:hypothetical protein
LPMIQNLPANGREKKAGAESITAFFRSSVFSW